MSGLQCAATVCQVLLRKPYFYTRFHEKLVVRPLLKNRMRRGQTTLNSPTLISLLFSSTLLKHVRGLFYIDSVLTWRRNRDRQSMFDVLIHVLSGNGDSRT